MSEYYEETTGKTRRSITAHDVAKLAGVSQSTVSRYYTPGSNVSNIAREKIRLAAEQLGYRPNLIARSLIKKKSNLIGIILPLNSNPYYQSILELLSTELNQHGYRILLFTNTDGQNSDLLMEEILHYPLDGLILIAVNLSSYLADQCKQNGLAVVMMTRKTESKMISSVIGNNILGVETIVEFLLEGEHRDFAYLAGEPLSSTNRDREETFLAALGQQGINKVQKAVGYYTNSGAVAAAHELLSRANRPDAIFCANDHMALCVLDVARHAYGLQPGRDISIIGFDDNYLAAWESFQLTTFSQPSIEMVAQAILLLIEQIENHDAAVKHIIVPGELLVRSSARLPKQGLIQIENRWVYQKKN